MFGGPKKHKSLVANVLNRRSEQHWGPDLKKIPTTSADSRSKGGMLAHAERGHLLTACAWVFFVLQRNTKL